MISVIICTYNRAGMLQRTLESFLAQGCLDDAPFELIVVDNNSSDETKAVVEAAQGGDGRVRYVFEGEQGLSAARNRGVDEARGEIVAFLDDDVIVSPEWLARMQRCFEETGADVVGGRAYLVYEADPPSWLDAECRQLLSEVDFGGERHRRADGRGLFGLNLAFRKAALTSAGAFDPALGRKGAGLLAGEETALVQRIAADGGTVVYEPDAPVGHIIAAERLRWDYFARVAGAMGYSLAKARRAPTSAGRIVAVVRSLAALLWTGVWAGVFRVFSPGGVGRYRWMRRFLTAKSRLRTQAGGLFGR